MKTATLVLALGVGLTAPAAFAEDTEMNYPFDPRWLQQEQQREAWIDQQRADRYQRFEERRADAYGRRGWYGRGLTDNDECWNPHAGHFEGVRPGESQDDLDFSRCRPKADSAYRPYRWR
jgi:hypothetical protein